MRIRHFASGILVLTALTASATAEPQSFTPWTMPEVSALPRDARGLVQNRSSACANAGDETCRNRLAGSPAAGPRPCDLPHAILCSFFLFVG